MPQMPEESQPEYVEQIRTAGEVARRCLALHGVLAAGHDVPREQIVTWLQGEGLWDDVSPMESAFLAAESPTPQQRINATWRAEALFSLLWSLDLISILPSPTQRCDLQLLQRALPPLFEPVTEFISPARLRRGAEIHNAREEIYHIHWRVRDARLRGQPTRPGQLPRMPAKDCEPPVEIFDAGVVQERHHSLNWLIGYRGQNWDDISTDT